MTIMSTDEDTELRDLVAQTLEANGVLGKIRAQLRASVFLALEEQEKVKNKTPLLNTELQKFLSTSEGCQVVSLVREFLQFFNLEYTLAVFDPEICCAPEKLENDRNVLGKSVNIVEKSDTSRAAPLLSSVVRQCKDGAAAPGRRSSLTENEEKAVNGRMEAENGKRAEKPTEKSAPRDKEPASDVDSDSFFDDLFRKKDKAWEQKDDAKKVSPVHKPGTNSMSSLAGLPSLTGNGKVAAGDSKEVTGSKLIDLDNDDDKYDDDFNESNISPVGQTPRSARSDKNVKSLDNDEIDEEIDEELSVADDLLKSEASANEDLTTDRTVSPAGQSTAGDYVEDVLHP